MFNAGIEAFLAIVRTQNISRAAEQLNLTQSTVSKRLKVLEQDINAVLFERGRGNKVLNLTPAGEAFIDMAERWHALWRETISLQGSSPNLSLSIGTLDSLNYAIFPRIYKALSRHTPRIKLKVITSHSYELYDLVEKRQVDVAFTLHRRDHPNIIIEKCFAEPMVVMRIGESSNDDHELIHPHELDTNDELFVYWGPNYQIWHDQWWNPSCPGQIVLDTSQLILSFFENENQWAIVPLSAAKTAQITGNYKISYISEPPPDRICYKISHKYSKASTLEGISILNQYLKML
ncbi:MAG: benM 1 [Clostridiales bacterium]|jgi:DNA-binding transcriptional LysR family regulator|nr:benM 1 [Clostridiales bacterium]